VRGRPGE